MSFGDFQNLAFEESEATVDWRYFGYRKKISFGGEFTIFKGTRGAEFYQDFLLA